MSDDNGDSFERDIDNALRLQWERENGEWDFDPDEDDEDKADAK